MDSLSLMKPLLSRKENSGAGRRLKGNSHSSVKNLKGNNLQNHQTKQNCCRAIQSNQILTKTNGLKLRLLMEAATLQ
jgi:hypothetical protein